MSEPATVSSDSQIVRFTSWLKKHRLPSAALFILSCLGIAISKSGDLQPFLEWSGLRNPYYGLYTGDSLLSIVPILDGQHLIFSLEGGYPGDNAKVAIYGDRCKWSLIADRAKIALDGDGCAISSDTLMAELTAHGSLQLSLEATNSFSQKLRNPDGTEVWSTILTYDSANVDKALLQPPPAIDSPLSKTELPGPSGESHGSAVDKTGHLPEAALSRERNETGLPQPEILDEVINELGTAQDSERFLRLNDKLSSIRRAPALTAEDVVKLLDGIRDHRLRIDAIENLLLPMLNPPFSVADTKLLLLGLDGSDKAELLTQLKPCIKDVDSPAARDSLLAGVMGDEWMELERALRSSSSPCRAGRLVTKLR